MNARNVITFFCLFSLLNGMTQQEPPMLAYWNNLMYFNPAVTGLKYKHEAHATWKNNIYQYVIEDEVKQQTIFVNYGYKLDKINSGVGINYCYDGVANSKINTAQISYAYHLPIKESTLSFGTSLGLKNFKQKHSWTTPSTVNDPLLPSLKNDKQFAMDLGLHFQRKKLNIGFSITNFSNLFLSSKKSSFTYTPYYWLFADYRFAISPKWSITPRTQVITDFVKLSYTLDLTTKYNERLWFGLGARVTDPHTYNFRAHAGYDVLTRFRLGYSVGKYFFFDIPSLTSNFGFIHEVTLGFLLK